MWPSYIRTNVNSDNEHDSNESLEGGHQPIGKAGSRAEGGYPLVLRTINVLRPTPYWLRPEADATASRNSILPAVTLLSARCLLFGSEASC